MSLELEEADLDRLYELLEARGIEVRDDCGREGRRRPRSTTRARAGHH